jgi:hypothetical protein
MLASFILWLVGPEYPHHFGGYTWVLIPMIVCGLGNSLFTAIISSCISAVIDKKLIGTAFGLASCS